MYYLGIVTKQLLSHLAVAVTVAVAVYSLLCRTILWSHQYLSSNSISIVSSVNAARSVVISRFAVLKIRSISADIAGIDRTSKAKSRRGR